MLIVILCYRNCKSTWICLLFWLWRHKMRKRQPVAFLSRRDIMIVPSWHAFWFKLTNKLIENVPKYFADNERTSQKSTMAWPKYGRKHSCTVAAIRWLHVAFYVEKFKTASQRISLLSFDPAYFLPLDLPSRSTQTLNSSYTTHVIYWCFVISWGIFRYLRKLVGFSLSSAHNCPFRSWNPILVTIGMSLNL